MSIFSKEGINESNNNWFAVYTKPRWEKKVASLLDKKKIENYCPLNRCLKQWSDRKKIVYEPLFTSYVFVHCSTQDYSAIRQTEGIINFVYWLGKPAIISDEEILTVKKFLNEHFDVRIEKINVDLNDRVRIVSGPLMSMEGTIRSVKNQTVKVNLPHLGFMMVADVDRTNIEIIAKNLLDIAVQN